MAEPFAMGGWDDPLALDPWEIAAQQLRRGVRSPRQEGLATKVLENAVPGMALSLTVPGHVARGTTPTVPGMWSEEDEFRQKQLEETARNWGPEMAMNMIGTGTPFSMSGAAGIAGGKLNTPGRTVWSDLAKTKHPIPVEEMQATRVPTGELMPRKTISPEELQGSILTPAVGDRTMAGHDLIDINGVPLANPVHLQGGPDFMRGAAAAADDAIWASKKGVISRLAKHGRSLAESGKDVNFVYSSLGGRSGDFSHMMADALLQQLPGAKITSEGYTAFNDAMKARSKAWPGLDSPVLRDKLMTNANMRKAFAEEMALGRHQDAGFPEIGSTRYAITEPALIGQPTGASGFAISRLDPSGRVILNPKVPHPSYNTQLGGRYIGGLEQSIPRELMFPDFYAARRAAGKSKLSDDRAFSMKNISQLADQQWLDRIMGYRERD